MKSTLGDWRQNIQQTRKSHYISITQTRTTLMYNMSNTECKAFTCIRKHLFNVNNMKALFENVSIDEILSFMRETKFDQKI